jgi:hypothetical protein
MRMYRSSDFSSLYSDLAGILQWNSEQLYGGGAGSSAGAVPYPNDPPLLSR